MLTSEHRHEIGALPVSQYASNSGTAWERESRRFFGRDDEGDAIVVLRSLDYMI